MKKKLLGLLIFGLLTTGCSDDDALANVNHQPVEEAILGKWYPQGGTINGGTFQPYENNDCETLKDYQEFEGGNLKFTGYNEACEIDETGTSPYSINGNILIVEDDIFVDQEFTITSLTAQQLVLTSTYNTPDGMETEVAYFARQ